MLCANKAGIPVFVTGGIGGVHRGGENSKSLTPLWALVSLPSFVASLIFLLHWFSTFFLCDILYQFLIFLTLRYPSPLPPPSVFHCFPFPLSSFLLSLAPCYLPSPFGSPFLFVLPITSTRSQLLTSVPTLPRWVGSQWVSCAPASSPYWTLEGPWSTWKHKESQL